MHREDELLLFENDWNRSIENNDVEQIGKFISDDWIIVGTEGGITSKDEFLAPIKSGDLTHSKMDSEEVRVKIYGDTGIVTSRGTSAGKFKGQDFELYEWSVSTFVFKDDKWVCVHTMLTPAKKIIK